MALTTPIQRTALVNAAQQAANGTVNVQLAIQPTASAPAANATLVVSAAEWNAIAAESSSGTGGTSGIGVSLAITLQ